MLLFSFVAFIVHASIFCLLFFRNKVQISQKNTGGMFYHMYFIKSTCKNSRTFEGKQILPEKATYIRLAPSHSVVLLYIFYIIHPQKQKRSVWPFCFWGEHSKGLSNQTDIEFDMINAISAADIAFIMLSSQLLRIDWMLSTNRIFHSESDV